MNNIYQYFENFGRLGELSGIFVATREEVEAVIGEEVYLGEVLGKHSEVISVMDWGKITLTSDDQEFVKKFIEIIGDGTVSGINPLDYYNWR